jgi:hypothetical protein
VLYTKSDGTEVTNFHEGIAKWAETSDAIRESEEWMNAIEKKIRYDFLHIRDCRILMIRKVECELTEDKSVCHNEIYCADKQTVGLNKQLTETSVAYIESLLVNSRK